MRFTRPGLDVLALMTMSMACDLTTLVMPLIVDALASQHGMSDAAVGFLTSAQLMSTALLAFALAPTIPRLSPRNTMAIGLVMVGGGNGLTLLAHDTLPLLICARLCAGLGEALVNVPVAVLIARRREPDLGFATVNIGITSGAVVVFLIAPLLAPTLGKDAIFWIEAALPALALPCVLGVRKQRLGVVGPGAVPGLRSAFAVGPTGAAVLLGVVGFGIAGNAIFVFVMRIGEGIGLGYDALVSMLLWVTVWTAAGPVAARIIGLRFGRMTILAACFLGVAVSDPMMGAPTSAGVLFAGLNLGGFCLLLALPFYNGLMAAMDPQGRLIALSRGVLAIGTAITPSIASLMLLSGGGFPAMGYWSAVICLMSLGLILYAGRSLDRGLRLQPAAAVVPLEP